MATWEEASRENFRAAQKLQEEALYRSCVSRSYYTAYCALVGVFTRKGIVFESGRQNPDHRELDGLIQTRLTGLRPNSRKEMKQALKRLRSARISADYRPGLTMDLPISKDCLRDAAQIVRSVGVIE